VGTDSYIWVQQAINEVVRQDGRSVSVDLEQQSIHRLGRNLNMTADVPNIIWNVGTADEILPAAGTNPIDRLVSSSASDTGTVELRGHTSDALGNKTFTITSVTITGQTPVVLTTPLHRVVDIIRTGTPKLVGNVFVYENTAVTAGVPGDLTKVHAKIDGALGYQRGNKAAITISSDVYFFITSWTFSVNRQQTGYCDFTLETKNINEVFREQAVASSSRDTGTDVITFRPFLIMKPNADLLVRGVASGTGIRSTTEISGVVASVRS
tara:strand:- start:15768 stop:16568 length:801 start_codon:yes stop_codon:yes gene_type:complete